MFTGADIKLMETTLQPKIKEATELMGKARAWYELDVQSHPAVAQRIIGDLEVRLVMQVTGLSKTIKTREPFANMEAIARQFAQDVKDAGGDLAKCPWKLPGAAPPAPAASAQQRCTILEFSADGGLDLGQLKSSFGFEPGTTVRLKHGGDGTVYHIANLDRRAVTLIAPDSTKKEVTTGELVDLYKSVKLEADIVVRSADFRKIEQHPLAITECFTNHARQLLFHAFRLYQPSVAVDMKLIKGRDRHLFAACNYQTGTLKLVPYSQNLYNVAAEGKEKVPSGPNVQIKVRQMGHGGSTFTATFSAASAPKKDDTSSKPFAKELLVPFWLVRSTGDKDRANMHHSTLKCTLPVQAGKEETGCDAVIIPILQNSKAVKEGDELLVFNGDLVKPIHSIEPSVPAPPQPLQKRKSSVPKRLNQLKRKAMKRS